MSNAPHAKLFVRNLSWNVTEDQLFDLLSDAGTVQSVKIPTRREDGKPRGFAFVEMATPDQAQEAIDQFDGYELDRRPIAISFQDESRGGGGGRGDRNSAPAAPNTKLFIRNISNRVTEADLQDFCQQVGAVVEARIPTDKFTGEPKGFGFVEMESVSDATAVIERLHEQELGGKELLITYQDPNRQSKRPPQRSGGYHNDRQMSRW